MFRKEGIEINSTYNFNDGETVVIAAPFLYKAGEAEIILARVIREENDRTVKIQRGQEIFTAGAEWFFNIWVPEFFKKRFMVPFKFSYEKTVLSLINIQELGDEFDAIYEDAIYEDGTNIHVKKEVPEGKIVYKFHLKNARERADFTLEFRILEEIKQQTLGFSSQKAYSDEQPSIFIGSETETGDLLLSYILFPKPVEPVKAYKIFLGPDGQLLDTKFVNCLSIEVNSRNTLIEKQRFSPFEKIGKNFPRGSENFRVSTDNFCEKLWESGNKYFLFEVELPEKRSFSLSETHILIGRDPRNFIRLPGRDRMDFRNIHSSRFHAMIVRSGKIPIVINLSPHFFLYIFRGKQLLTISPFKEGEEIYSRVLFSDFKGISPEKTLEFLTVRGIPPAFSPLQKGDFVLIGNTVFKILSLK